MKTGSKQSWSYLKAHYHPIYNLALETLKKQRGFSVELEDSMGINQIIWINTEQGGTFWSRIWNDGNILEFEEKYGPAINESNFFTTLNLISC